MKVYLAGPMTGYDDYNFPAFFTAAAKLEAMGHEVFNPAQNDLDTWGDMETVKAKANYRDCLRMDLNWMLDHAEAIACLPGWDDSRGARLEADLAHLLDLKYLGVIK